MITDSQEKSGMIDLRALARALVLQRQPERFVMHCDADGNLISDPFARYGRAVAVLPEKLPTELWAAKYGHLAATAETPSVPAPPTRESASASDGLRRQQAIQGKPVGVRRRSRFRP